MKEDLRARYAEEKLPRYTSDPTAPRFSDAVGHEALDSQVSLLKVCP